MKFKKLIAMLSLAVMCTANVFAMKSESPKITELRNHMIDVAKKVVSPENTNPFVFWLKKEGIADAPHIYSTWGYNCFDMTHCGDERLSKEHKEKFRDYVVTTLKAVNVVPYSLQYFWKQQTYGDLYWLLRAHDGGMTSWTYKILNDHDLLSHENTVAHIRNTLRGIENRPDFFGNCYIGALIAANKCEELGLKWFIVCQGDNAHWDCIVEDSGVKYVVNFIGCVNNVYKEKSPLMGAPHYAAVQPVGGDASWQGLLIFAGDNVKTLEDQSVVKFNDTTPCIDFLNLIHS